MTVTDNAGVLNILEIHLKAMEAEHQNFTQKAQQIIGLSTIVVGFATALNTLDYQRLQDVQRLYIVGDFIIYGGVFFLYILTVWPRKWCAYPVTLGIDKVSTSAKIDELRALNAGDEFYGYLFDRFSVCLCTNQARLDDMAVHVRWSTILLFVQILVIGITKLL